MTVLDWLLDSDPALRWQVLRWQVLRWQVLRDLSDAPPEVVAAERARRDRGVGRPAARIARRRRPVGWRRVFPGRLSR